MQNDSDAYVAELSVMNVELFRVTVDKTSGDWYAKVLKNELILKGFYEEDGNVTTIALRETKVRTNTDLSLSLTLTLNEKDRPAPLPQSEVQNIFTASAEDLAKIRDRAQRSASLDSVINALAKLLQSVS